MMTHGVPLLLLSAAIGYWVLERSSSQKKDLKTVGQIVGTAIIVISFLGVACKIYAITKYGRGGYTCPMKMACPMGMKCPGASCPICSQKAAK